MEDNSQTNLIINYLPQTLTDEEFYNLFKEIGTMKSCKICRDKASGYSYGFGFVDYSTPEEAQVAMEALNGLELQNKKIKVALARPDTGNIKGANLYVGHLPQEYGESELASLFQSFGNIIQVRLLRDNITGVSKKTGFILFSTKEEAAMAIKAWNNNVPKGGTEPLLVKYADDGAKKVPPAFVMYPPSRYPVPSAVPPTMGPGPVRNMPIRPRFNPMAPNSRKPMGGGGVGDDDDQSQKGHVIYVYNIGYSANEQTLWSLFSPYGTILKVNVIYDHKRQQCKGFGFVTMENMQHAEYAIQCLDGYQFGGRKLQVRFHNKQPN